MPPPAVSQPHVAPVVKTCRVTHAADTCIFRAQPIRDGGSEPVVASRLEEARTQLRGYLADPGLRGGQPGVRHVGLAVVFHG